MENSCMNFCPKCGYENENGAKFCINCGATIDERSNHASEPMYRSSASEEYAFPASDLQTPGKSQRGLIIGILLGIVAVIVVIVVVLIKILFPSGDEPVKVEPTHPAGYHAPLSYDYTDPSTLEYGDEETIKDFSYTDGWTTLSDSAVRLYDFDDAVGFWKAVMISDPENTTEEGEWIDYFNVEIYGAKEEASVIFNWDHRVTSSTGEDLKLRGGSVYNGTFSDGVLTAAEHNGVVTITDFWSDNGTQYAVGTYIWSDGSIGYIGLIRENQ